MCGRLCYDLIRTVRKSFKIPDGEMIPIYLGVTTNTEMGHRVCMYMVSTAEIVSMRGGGD